MRRKKKELLRSSVKAAVYLVLETAYQRWAQGHAVSVPWEEQGSGLLLGDLDVWGRQAPAEPARGDWELGSTTLEQP